MKRRFMIKYTGTMIIVTAVLMFLGITAAKLLEWELVAKVLYVFGFIAMLSVALQKPSFFAESTNKLNVGCNPQEFYEDMQFMLSTRLSRSYKFAVKSNLALYYHDVGDNAQSIAIMDELKDKWVNKAQKLVYYNNLAIYYAKCDKEKARECLEEAKAIAAGIRNQKRRERIEAVLRNSEATVLFYEGDLDKALEYISQPVQDSIRSKAYAEMLVGKIFFYKGMFEDARNHFLTCLTLANKLAIADEAQMYLQKCAEEIKALS